MQTSPDVSVIIPVYNAVDYIQDAVGSVLEQSIAPERVEIVVVDDGSTDGSDRELARLADGVAGMTVITQENSGTAGGARNTGLDHARGTFVFFLDADDVLAPGALGKLVDTAIDEESDVVLGKLASSDRRRVPTSMFQKTVLDAHLVEDRVFHTLGPTKLIRRELIEARGLRFPADLRVGEDEPFMAAVYLAARKISVLSDQDYYIVRYREDGQNLTLTKHGSVAHAEVAMRVAEVVERATTPGPYRDALLTRPLDRPLARALDARWNTMEPPARAQLAEEIRSRIGHLCTEGAAAHLRAETRMRLDLLLADNLPGLSAYIAHRASTPAVDVIWVDGAFRPTLPADVRELIPLDVLRADPPKMTPRLEALSVAGSTATVTASIAMPALEGSPDEIVLRARGRDTHEGHDLRTTTLDLPTGEAPALIEAVAEDLPRGVWDLYVVVRFGDWEKVMRLGADRSRTVAPEGASNVGESPAPQDRFVAYFTKNRGNLSFDRGSILHRQLSQATVHGVTLDENGRPNLLVLLSREPRRGDRFVATISDFRHHNGRHDLPVVQLGERLLALRLPLTPEMAGAKVLIESVLGGVRATLPITAVEFWPSRAAGFRVTAVEGGGLAVHAHTSLSAASGRVIPQDRLPSLGQVRDQVSRIPLIGPAARRAARAARGLRR